MSFPLLFAWIPFSYVPIPSSGSLKKCFANLQFTCQTALAGRLPWLSEEIIALIRAGVYGWHGAKHAPPFRLRGCNIQRASFGMSPQAGPSPGQGSHLLSLGNVSLNHCSSAMRGMCHQRPLTVPFFKASGACSPHVLMANTSRDAPSGLQPWLLQPAF